MGEPVSRGGGDRGGATGWIRLVGGAKNLVWSPLKFLHLLPFPFQSLHGREWPRENLEGRPRPLPGQLPGPLEVKRHPPLSVFLASCGLQGLNQTSCRQDLTSRVDHALLFCPELSIAPHLPKNKGKA